MPDVQSGLQTGEPDVNSDAGFNAAVAGSAGIELDEGAKEKLDRLESEDRSVRHGLEESSPSRERDELGRFKPAAQPDAEVDEGATPDEDVEEQDDQPDDPWAQAPEELRAERERLQSELEEAQRFQGRQANEVGELRQQLAELKGATEALAASRTAPRAAPFISEEMIARAEQSYQQEGPERMMLRIADAVEMGALPESMIDEGLKLWAADDPVEAARMATRMELLMHGQQAPQREEQPQRDPFVESLRAERQVKDVMGRVKESVGPAWDVVKQGLPQAIESAPESLQNDIISGDTEKQFAAINFLAQNLKVASQAATTERARADKQRAQVATGSLRPAPKRQPGEEQSPQDRQERLNSFYRSLLDAPSTDVASNLVEVRR